MVKEKQSFFDKISSAKKTPLRIDDADENNSPVVPAEEESKEIQEGQLAVDVYETNSTIVVESIIGGVNPGDINVAVSNNVSNNVSNTVLTIKGVREKSEDPEENVNYFVSECFWGPFSRSVILPCEVDVDLIKASIKKGVLKITLPKLVGGKTKKIIIEEV